MSSKKIRLVKPVASMGKPVNGSDTPTPDDQLTQVEVPISFGTSLDDVLGAVEHEQVTITVKQFMEDYAKNIDVRPPYQRDDAWALRQQSAFIQSVFNKGMAIPPLFLCKKTKRPDCAKFWALDCRQRTTALMNFFSDKIKITVYHYWGSGAVTSKKLTWSEINQNESYSGLRLNFLSRRMDLNVMGHMPLGDQRIIFEALNNGTPLNMDEITYCKHFLTRKVLATLYAQVFGRISKHLVSSVRNERRFAHIRAIHEVLILVGGQGWSEKSVEPRALRKQERLGSAKLIHRQLEELKFDYEDDVTTEVRRSLGLHGKVTLLTDIANLLSDIFDEETMLGREERGDGSGLVSNALNARQVIDPLGFLFGKVQEGTASVESLRQHRQSLVKFLKAFYTQKPELSLNQSTSDIKVMKGKFELMEKLFNKHLKSALAA